MTRGSSSDPSRRRPDSPPTEGSKRPARGAGGRSSDEEVTPPAKGVERIVAKVESTLTNHAAHHERIAEKVAAKAERQQDAARKMAERAEQLERMAGQLGTLDIWTRRKPEARRPRFTREEIAVTAVRIADEEGFAALSMRHLASELGAGTMTLYHYVKTKDELLALVMDTLMGEVVLGADDVMPDGWRDALTLIAQRTRAALVRHPWWIEIVDEPHLGPNMLLHLDQTVEAVSSLDLPLAEKIEITSVVDEYVFGYCVQDRNRPSDFEEPPEELVSYVEELVDTGSYPQLAALMEEFGSEQVWVEMAGSMQREGRFERNLNRILDGIEANLR